MMIEYEIQGATVRPVQTGKSNKKLTIYFYLNVILEMNSNNQTAIITSLLIKIVELTLRQHVSH